LWIWKALPVYYDLEVDDNHGSQTAATALGTTYGVASKSVLHPVRVLGCDGNGYGADFTAGLEFVANHPAAIKIASLSLGFASVFQQVDGP
jgi:hypothetical protein